MNKAYKVAISGIFLALSATISTAEAFIPLPLGVKPGFSNIPVMASMHGLGTGISLSIVILKSVFVLFTRGVTAFTLSLSGGLLSFIVMLLIFKKTKASFLLISVFGSLAHNFGQAVAACFIMQTFAIAAYLPVLIISACIAGIATGLTTQILITKIPLLSKGEPDEKN